MTERRSVDQDGVVQIELRPGAARRWQRPVGLAALVALAGLGLFIFFPGRSGEPARGRGGQEVAGAREGSRPSPRRRPGSAAGPGAAALPGGEADPGASRDPEGEPDPADDERGADEEQGAMEQGAGEPGEPALDEQERAGIPGMPPHGTKAIKEGIVVPEDFPLPPGYVRHYQTTDSGRMLDAILMFHPDHRPVDAHGRPVPMPPDRIVPPELAPPGLPIEVLKVPDDAYTRPDDDGAVENGDE